MLQWYEQDEGHQLLMAKRPEGILAAMKAVLSKHEAAEIKGYWEIDVWGPSPEIQARAIAIEEQEAREDFWQHIVSTARFSSRRKLPPPLKPCPGFEPLDPNGESDTEYHYGCKNCRDMIQIDVPDKEAFYQERKRMFESTLQHHPVKGLVESRATPAQDGQPLMVAGADFGHHSYGVLLHEFKMPEVPTEPHRHTMALNEVLFFYTIVKSLPDNGPKELITTLKKKFQEEDRRERESYTQKRKREEDEHWNEFLALLKGPSHA